MTSSNLPSPANQNRLPVKPKKTRHRQWSAATFGLLIGLAGLLLGRLGHLWIGFDIFSQFSIHFIFLGLAMAIGMVFPRFKSLAGIVFFTMMVVAYGLWPMLASDFQFTASQIGDSKQLKVASFNALYNNTETKRIIVEVTKINPDVMALVEFSANKQAVLDGLRSAYPYQADCFTVPNCDAVLISKYPLTNIIGEGNWEGPPLLQASLGPEFGNLTIFAVHTTRFPHSRSQFAQVNALVKHIETVPSRIVIMGDFNATPFSRITETISIGLDLKRVTSLPTWPTRFNFPQLAIDHIFVSPDIQPMSAEQLGGNAGSDHFPISITLAIPQK